MALFSEADLIIAIGSRMGDVSSLGFAYPRQDPNRQKFVHVYRDASMIGRHFQTDLSIASTAHGFVRAALLQSDKVEISQLWLDRARSVANRVHGWQPDKVAANDVMGHTVTALARLAKTNAVITTDSGNFAAWVHRIFKMSPSNRLLGSACGAMGSGVPSGVAAGLRFPGREVLTFVGDGGFLMNGNELITAVERGLNMKTIVSNNGSYGTIRTHQQRHFPGRVSGTNLANPSFAKLAEAFGARGFLIESSKDAAHIVEEAMKINGPVLIEVRNDPDVSVAHSIDKE
jgi:acetolactate synthase-1/2/3 large subunit